MTLLSKIIYLKNWAGNRFFELLLELKVEVHLDIFHVEVEVSLQLDVLVVLDLHDCEVV